MNVQSLSQLLALCNPSGCTDTRQPYTWSGKTPEFSRVCSHNKPDACFSRAGCYSASRLNGGVSAAAAAAVKPWRLQRRAAEMAPCTMPSDRKFTWKAAATVSLYTLELGRVCCVFIVSQCLRSDQQWGWGAAVTREWGSTVMRGSSKRPFCAIRWVRTWPTSAERSQSWKNQPVNPFAGTGVVCRS